MKIGSEYFNGDQYLIRICQFNYLNKKINPDKKLTDFIYQHYCIIILIKLFQVNMFNDFIQFLEYIQTI